MFLGHFRVLWGIIHCLGNHFTAGRRVPLKHWHQSAFAVVGWESFWMGSRWHHWIFQWLSAKMITKRTSVFYELFLLPIYGLFSILWIYFLKSHIAILFPLSMSFSECGGQFWSWPQSSHWYLCSLWTWGGGAADLPLAISKVEATAFL